MKGISISALAVVLGACAGQPPAPAIKPAEQSEAPVAVMETLVDRSETRARTCRVVRSLDGRTVCAMPKLQQHATTTKSATVPQTRFPARLVELPADEMLAHGRYLVIGSFKTLENARQWADYNADFGTNIWRAPRFEPAMYRVLIGPMDRAGSDLMQDVLSGVGVAEVWQLSVCDDGPGMSDANCTAPEGKPGMRLAGTDSKNH